jgi:hypothetical protein
MSYVVIGNKIEELLGEIAELNGRVYSHEPDELAKYPCATVKMNGHENQFGDTGRNIRSYSFLIRLYYRSQNNATAESVLRDITDKVIVKLESNVSIANVWEIARPTNARTFTIDRELPVQVVEISMNAEVRPLR